MSTAVRDSQRRVVYEAEYGAFAETLVDETLSTRHFQTLADLLFAQPAWQDSTGGCTPRVVTARSDARRSVAVGGRNTGWTIRIAPGHTQPPTLSHEAAHILCETHPGTTPTDNPGHAAHGPRFRSAHLWVAHILLGSHGAGLLATAYRGARLNTLSPSSWGASPDTGTYGLHGSWRRSIAM